ncbi:putative DNA-binding transcriptional regulator YafY [Clostridium beijerinckii]|uniref:helix-turn-helix transcriptional regulator n=1 Tax=Clostridium beijerinckii TaxID=1520 RepID=UPI001494B956|nr:WYL domain-containing protein [Clostridium beijerinckii]NOW90689.1 putative DNA-binding transcriptional regulator YafY [Clostridium beijerinckii]
MEESKSYVLLFIYNELKDGKVVTKDDVLNKFKINERTFYRYIKEIKDFVSEESKDSNGELIGEEVIAEKDGYILKGKHSKTLNEKEVLAISKVLLESRGFVKNEIKGMMNNLINNCVCKGKENIKFIIGNELVNYVSPRHGTELLDKLWQISDAIKKQKILEIGYCKLGIDGKMQEEMSKRIIYPQGLMFSEYYFYLIGFIEGRSDEYPTIFRVDRIRELITTDKNYKVDHSKRFEDGEFRKLIQFMQSGELERIKFRFKGGSIEAVLDRLPNAKIIKEDNGEYIIEAKMFGKGIKMWLLSQGEFVEVLGPDNFREEMKNAIEGMRKLYN